MSSVKMSANCVSRRARSPRIGSQRCGSSAATAGRFAISARTRRVRAIISSMSSALAWTWRSTIAVALRVSVAEELDRQVRGERDEGRGSSDSEHHEVPHDGPTAPGGELHPPSRFV
jgi:hypothetical protein